jgi:hypothetical protein
MTPEEIHREPQDQVLDEASVAFQRMMFESVHPFSPCDFDPFPSPSFTDDENVPETETERTLTRSTSIDIRNPFLDGYDDALGVYVAGTDEQDSKWCHGGGESALQWETAFAMYVSPQSDNKSTSAAKTRIDNVDTANAKNSENSSATRGKTPNSSLTTVKDTTRSTNSFQKHRISNCRIFFHFPV